MHVVGVRFVAGERLRRAACAERLIFELTTQATVLTYDNWRGQYAFELLSVICADFNDPRGVITTRNKWIGAVAEKKDIFRRH